MNASFDNSDFSTENYFRLLQILSDSGYATVDFAAVDHGKKHLILRHDVDFDLLAASRMADLEARNGYRSTYFVLLTSEFYNPISGQGRAAMAAISSLGHTLGLHFDTSLHDADETVLSDAAEAECRLLQELTGQKIDVISMHRPPSKLVGENVDFAGRLNTYSSYFTKEMGYCSDSRGAWLHGSPLECDAYKQGKALQLLTHPIWWTQETPYSPQQSVTNFLLARSEFLSREAARNCKAYTHAINGRHPTGRTPGTVPQ